MLTLPHNLIDGWEVLLIDDEDDSLAVAEIILSEYGAKVYLASDGQQALDLLETIHPKFIISDLSMPVLDGWGFIHALRLNRRYDDIPVIALTAHAMRGDRERGLAAGFHNYLTKPLTVDTFMHDLVTLLIDIPGLAQELALN